MTNTYTVTLPVEWREDVREEPKPGEYHGRRIGFRIMRGTVTATIDLEGVARGLGRRALTNKGKKAVDGCIVVKLKNAAVEVRRHTQPAPVDPLAQALDESLKDAGLL